MSFSKVGPAGGWSFGAKLTSAQMNQLDTDHANALDKTTAGDTLSGVIIMASTAAINISNAGAAIVSSVADGIVSQHSFGITTTAAGGICAGTSGGISDGGVSGGIAATTAGGIQSGVAGGIELTGGSGDWITYSSARSVSIWVPFFAPIAQLQTGWAISGSTTYLTGPGTSQIQPIAFQPRNGWTLTAVNLQIAVSATHSGGPPANFPGIFVWRSPVLSINSSPTFTDASLNSSATYLFFTASTGSGWYNSGEVQQISYACNQNNVINTSQYYYGITIVDENGTNSASGNSFLGVMLQYTVSNSAPW